MHPPCDDALVLKQGAGRKLEEALFVLVSGGTSSRSLGGDANGSARGTPPIDDASVWDARLAAALGSLWTDDRGSYTCELPREAAGAERGQAPLVGNLRQRVCLIHEL